jgi:ribulose bisphosphate carboxylase small subunit
MSYIDFSILLSFSAVKGCVVAVVVIQRPNNGTNGTHQQFCGNQRDTESSLLHEGVVS